MRLIRLNESMYRVESTLVTFEASPELTRKHLIEDLLIEPKELDLALKEMELKDHDAALFGVHGHFVHTYKVISAESIIAHCRAIEEMQEEFARAALVNPNSQETHEAHERLYSLRVSLDLRAIRELLGDKIDNNCLPKIVTA